jgi:hypothetical protein
MNDHMHFHFTSHYNWEWVLKQAVKEIEDEYRSKFSYDEATNLFRYCEKFSDLPSVLCLKASGIKLKVEYSIFRIDLFTSSEGALKKEDFLPLIRGTSPVFQRTDAKDLFYYKAIQQFKKKRSIADADDSCYYLPKTILIPWNALEANAGANPREILLSFIPTFPSYPAVLKAPMGSGGFGIYFVYHIDDIFEIMKNHLTRAKNDSKFIEKIENLYQNEEISLSWSLQEFIQPIKSILPIAGGANNEPQRTQVRAYIIECDSQLYLYKDYEVRCPCWDIPLEETLKEEQERFSKEENRQQERVDYWEDPVEDECCGRNGYGRPYNEKRNKKLTYRFMISELSELKSSIPIITKNLIDCFQDLKELLLREKQEEEALKKAPDSSIPSVTFAVIGIDLLVSKNAMGHIEVKIVEVNNHPAMPQQGKLMSSLYLRHLIELQKSFVGLALSHSVKKTPIRILDNSFFCNFSSERLAMFRDI